MGTYVRFMLSALLSRASISRLRPQSQAVSRRRNGRRQTITRLISCKGSNNILNGQMINEKTTLSGSELSAEIKEQKNLSDQVEDAGGHVALEDFQLEVLAGDEAHAALPGIIARWRIDP